MSTLEMRGSAIRAIDSSPRASTLRRAPFALRCGALLIDYILLVGIIAASTLFARAADSNSFFGAATITIGFVLAALFIFFNYIALAAWTGRTIGKWATGLRIVHPDAEGIAREIGVGRAFLRHTIGYTLSLLTLGGGFMLAAFNEKARALHDFIAGTIVVRD